MLGRIDEDGIAAWYPKCKVRKEGDHYIATPHTTNPTRRTVRKQKEIAVSVKDGKYALEEKPIENAAVKDGVKYATVESGQTDEPNSSVHVTTLKQIFDELYDKYYKQYPNVRKQSILKDMLPLFSSKEDALYFVDEQFRRKWRNAYTRKQRFAYKAYNQNYEYFFTITFDSKKHTEQSFEKSLKNALSNLHKRYGCLFQGAWERGSENDRLHFHGLIYDPNKKITGELETVKDYNPKTGKMKTYLQSKYFFEKFGRNEFSEIIPQMYQSAIKYITKYLNKQDVKPYFSKGLYRFIESDIVGNDVICKMDSSDERDIRLIVSNKFKIWDEGALIGEASPETIAKAKKVS
ncbi:rolling circle replication-associated protein [Pumilibacter intestinalis]|uniref:rolling circle replication-associated protein n=1 Tax=Pumilibacter intestinalis TaxID=2941511 RepID=UPI00203A8316|nr:hypothetical protein [Pumilibacter intestinalis]